VFLCKWSRCTSVNTRKYSSRTWSYSDVSPSCDQWLFLETTLEATWNGASAAEGEKSGARVAGLTDWYEFGNWNEKNSR